MPGSIGEFGFRFLMDLGYRLSRDQVAAVAEAVRPIVGPQAAFEDAGEQGDPPWQRSTSWPRRWWPSPAVAIGGLVLTGLLLAPPDPAAEDLEALRPLGMTGGDRAGG